MTDIVETILPEAPKPSATMWVSPQASTVRCQRSTVAASNRATASLKSFGASMLIM